MSTTPPPARDALLRMSDIELLRHCRIGVCRGSGRGGQKRNTTDSAVRATLPGHPEITVDCDTTRSQHRNRALALRRLRHRIALHLRQPVDPSAPPPMSVAARPSRRHPDYPAWLATVLDHAEACNYQVGPAARQLGLPTGRLIRLLADDPELWRKVNQERRKRGLKPLRQS